MTADATLSVLGDVLQKDILPDIQSLLPKETMLYDQFYGNQKPVRFHNNTIYFSAAVNGHTGVNTSAEGGDVNSGTPTWDQMNVSIKTTVGSHKLTLQAIKAAKGQPGALADALSMYGMELMSQIAKNFDRQFTSYGEGVLTTVTVAGTVTTMTVDNAHPLLVGETYQVGTKAQVEAATADDVAPTDVNYFNNTATISSTAVALADVVVKKTCHTTTTYYDMMGIAGLVDDASLTSTWQGVTRSGNSYVNSYIEDTAGVLTASEVTTLVQMSQRFGSPDFIVTSQLLQNKYASDLTALKRIVNSTKLAGGWSGISVTAGDREIPMTVNHNLPTGSMYSIDKDQFKYAELMPIEWLDEGEGVLKILNASTGQGVALQYQAALVAMGNLVCFNPRSSAGLLNRKAV